MHAAWAVALTLAPRRFARHLLAQRFIFNRRSRFAEALLKNIWRFGRLTTLAASARNKERAKADRCATGSAGPRFAAAKGNDDAGI